MLIVIGGSVEWVDFFFFPEDMEKLREMETSGEMGSARSNFSAVVAKLGDVQSLCEAFEGCAGVFHTSAFADPAGISGYTVSVHANLFSTSPPSLLV